MKIAMANALLPNDQKGGVPSQAHYLANALVKRGHDVTMFTCSKAFDECLYRVRTFPYVFGLPKRAYAFLQAAHLASSDLSSFDIVHAHGDNYLLWNRAAQVRTFHGAAKDEARFATTRRRKLFYRVMSRLEWLGARVSTQNVGVSEATRATIGTIDEVIPCGVDLDAFAPGTKSEEPSILFVGGMTGRKRGALLLEAFRRHVKPTHPAAVLWLVAEDATAAGDGVSVLGKVSLERLTELYRRAWVFCLPSSYEGFGVPYVEAMASGTAVVASPNPGALEVLAGGRYGIIAADDDLGASVSSLLDDARLRERYVESGTLRAKDFDWNAICAAYERVYAQAFADRSTFISRALRRRR